MAIVPEVDIGKGVVEVPAVEGVVEGVGFHVFLGKGEGVGIHDVFFA